MSIESLLEAVLYASGQQVSIKKLAAALSLDDDAVRSGLNRLQADLEKHERGISLIIEEKHAELVTSADAAEAVRAVLEVEAQGELSKAALEALAIIAYRGPITRPELEQIRGIQSSMILRILSMRGLIEQKEETRLGQPVYSVTTEFYKHMGYTAPEQLPDYQSLRNHNSVESALAELDAPTQPSLNATQHDS